MKQFLFIVAIIMVLMSGSDKNETNRNTESDNIKIELLGNDSEVAQAL